MSVNKQILVGNVGKAPEITIMDGDKKIANFSVATVETYRNKQGEKIQNTEWHRVTFFEPISSKVIEPFLNSGDKVYIEGKTETRKYTDKEGNDKEYKYVKGKEITLLGSREKPSDLAPQYHAPPQNGEGIDDTLPF